MVADRSSTQGGDLSHWQSSYNKPVKKSIFKSLHVFYFICLYHLSLAKNDSQRRNLLKDISNNRFSRTSELVLASRWEQVLQEDDPAWATDMIGDPLLNGSVNPGSAQSSPSTYWGIYLWKYNIKRHSMWDFAVEFSTFLFDSLKWMPSKYCWTQRW